MTSHTPLPSRNALSSRTLLFVPGDRPDRFGKAAAARPDAVVIDLEDAVSAENKALARDAAFEWIEARPQTVIRLNGVDSPWFDDDLEAFGRLACPIMIPKYEGRTAEPVASLTAEGRVVIALIETATGILEARDIAHSGVRRLALGNADLAAQLGVAATNRDALAAARAHLVLASAEAGLERPIDGITPEFRDLTAVAGDAAYAASLGFGGKLCIHPAQLDPVRTAFGPSHDEIDWAREVLAAAESAGPSSGAISHGGRMIDRPLIERARAILALAEDT